MLHSFNNILSRYKIDRPYSHLHHPTPNPIQTTTGCTGRNSFTKSLYLIIGIFVDVLYKTDPWVDVHIKYTVFTEDQTFFYSFFIWNNIMKIFPNETLYIQFIRAFCKTIQNKEVSRRLYFNSSNRYWYGCVRALYNNLLPITPCICGQNTFDPARQVSCVYHVGQGR